MKQKPFSPVPESSYPWQFLSHIKQLINFILEYQKRLLGLTMCETQIAQLKVDAGKINSKGGEWSATDSQNISILDKSIEEANLSKRRIEIQIHELLSEVPYLTSNIFGFWPHIKGDFDGDFISKEAFLSYLIQYKVLLENTAGLTELKKAPADEILKAIAEYIPENPVAKL